MAKRFYLPAREPERVVWLNNFAAKLPIHGPLTGITPAEITQCNAFAVYYSYIIGLLELTKTYRQDLTKFKNRLSIAPLGTALGALPVHTPAAAPAAVSAGIFTIISGFVKRIKGSTAYSEAMGEDLGIVGDDTTFDPANYKPALKGKDMPGFVEISFVKESVDGMNIFSHPAGSTDPNAWDKLSFDSESPYHDTRPLAAAAKPEVREYRARGVLNDAEIGQWSDIVRVTFSG